MSVQASLFPERRRRPPATERRTHIALADFLRRFCRSEWLWMHIPNGEYRTEKTGALLKRMGVMPGAADFLLIDGSGKHYWLELKRGTAPLSMNQIRFRTELRARGVPYAVAHSFDDAVAQLNEWRVLKPVKFL